MQNIGHLSANCWRTHFAWTKNSLPFTTFYSILFPNVADFSIGLMFLVGSSIGLNDILWLIFIVGLFTGSIQLNIFLPGFETSEGLDFLGLVFSIGLIFFSVYFSLMSKSSQILFSYLGLSFMRYFALNFGFFFQHCQGIMHRFFWLGEGVGVISSAIYRPNFLFLLGVSITIAFFRVNIPT